MRECEATKKEGDSPLMSLRACAVWLPQIFSFISSTLLPGTIGLYSRCFPALTMEMYDWLIVNYK